MFALALALLPAVAAITEPDETPRPPVAAPLGAECRNAERHDAVAPKQARPGLLAEEPAADLYLGVMRIEGGCDKPVKIREAIDSAPGSR